VEAAGPDRQRILTAHRHAGAALSAVPIAGFCGWQTGDARIAQHGDALDSALKPLTRQQLLLVRSV
jgi:hypothetical protein